MSKTKFRNKFERCRCHTCCGDRIVPVFSSKMNDDGSIELAITDKKNLYEEIQSHKDSVDIKTLLKQYEAGDVTALEKVTGQYMDISEIPNNLIGVLKTVENARYEFEQLPLSVREQYDFDVNKFVADIGSDNWLNAMYPDQTGSISIDGNVENSKVGDDVNE